MKTFAITTLLLFASQAAIADNHSTEAGAVLELIQKHWDARNEGDYAAQLNLMSKGTHYHANSNGTFFSSGERPTEDEYEEALGGTEYDVSVYHADAVSLSDTVVLARYYLEGSLKTDDASVSNYRTRVTHIWVKENGMWKSKSWHFSPLHDGGTTLN